jgi:hypothetical protein
MLYKIGEGVLHCAFPLSRSKFVDKDPSSKTIHADLPVHGVLRRLMKFGPNPKNSKTLFIAVTNRIKRLCLIYAQYAGWNIVMLTMSNAFNYVN